MAAWLETDFSTAELRLCQRFTPVACYTRCCLPRRSA